MARHLIMVEVTPNEKSLRRLWKKAEMTSGDPEKAAIYGARYQGIAFSGDTTVRAGGDSPLVAGTRAVRKLLAAYYRD